MSYVCISDVTQRHNTHSHELREGKEPSMIGSDNNEAEMRLPPSSRSNATRPADPKWRTMMIMFAMFACIIGQEEEATALAAHFF